MKENMMDVQHDGPRAIKLTSGARRNDQQDCKLASSSITLGKVMRLFAQPEQIIELGAGLNAMI
jgi:hypothetical protein